MGQEKSFKNRLFLIKKLDKIPTCEWTPEPATEPEGVTEPTKAAKAKAKINAKYLH